MIGRGITAHLPLHIVVDYPLGLDVTGPQTDGIGIHQRTLTHIALAIDVHYVVTGGLQQALLCQHAR